MPQIAPLRGAYVRCFRQGHGVAHSDSSNGSGSGSPAGRIAREVSSLQASLLASLREELGQADPDQFATAAERLAVDFGSVTATAVDAAREPEAGAAATVAAPASRAPASRAPASRAAEEHQELASLYQPGHMRRRLEQMAAGRT